MLSHIDHPRKNGLRLMWLSLLVERMTMDFLSRNIRRVLLLTGLSLAAGLAAAQTPALGSRLDELLVLARQQSPELAAVRLEADAAAERITAAGALPDPKFRMCWRQFKSDHLCQLNFDQGLKTGFVVPGCG
jgi:hypothetical protein